MEFILLAPQHTQAITADGVPSMQVINGIACSIFHDMLSFIYLVNTTTLKVYPQVICPQEWCIIHKVKARKQQIAHQASILSSIK